MDKWYRLGLISALLPLVTGTVIFVPWIITRQEWLYGAGFFTIGAGLILFVFGIFFTAKCAGEEGYS